MNLEVCEEGVIQVLYCDTNVCILKHVDPWQLEERINGPAKMKVFSKDISNRKVLLIDDEVDLCLLMKVYFLRRNCPVRIARNIEEALLLFGNYVPEVIFLDSDLCKDLKETGDRILEAAPMAWLIITGENRANRYFDYVG